MKILSLRLSNLASIAGEHVIEFNQKPLKNAGLIAITGITGAGKTTLLDAICLALFDQIPRLQHAESHKKIIDTSGDEVLINSTRHILRRGCVQGFAEVEFIAQDGKHYLARWEVKRARLKVTGKLQDVQRVLRCVSDSQLISERTSECNKKITELLGLNFNQFTRAVLLAQSEVTAFLKAKDSERADLLEYLTNSDIYSRIGIASFAATKEAREQVEIIQKKIGDQPVLTDEERQALKHELQQTRQAISQQQAERQQLEQQISWYGEQQRLQQQLDQQQDKQVQVQQQLMQFQPEIQLLGRLEQFEGIRDQFLQRRHIQQQLATQQQRQQTVQQKLDQLLPNLLNAQQEQQLQLAKVRQCEQQQQHSKSHIAQAQQLEHGLASLVSHIAQQQLKLQHIQVSIEPDHTQQQALQQQKTVLIEQQQTAQQILQDCSELAQFDAEPQSTIQRIQQAASLRDSLQQQNASLLGQPMDQQQAILNRVKQHIAGFIQHHQSMQQLESTVQRTRQQLDKHNKQLLVCERLDDQLKLWQSLEQQTETLQQQHGQQQQELQTQTSQLQLAQIATQQAEHQLKTVQQLAQEQRLLTSQTVQALRDQLQPDHACMVCGSTEHPFYDPQVLITALSQQFDQPLHQAEQALAQTRKHEHQLLKQLTQLETTQLQLQLNLQQLETTRQQVFHKIQEISPNFYQRLQDNLTLNFASQRLHDAHQQLQNSQQQTDSSLQQYQEQLKQWQEQEQQLQQLQQFMEKQQALNLLEQQVIVPLGNNWQASWQQDYHSSSQQLTQQIEIRLQVALQLKQQEQLLQQLQQDLSHLNMLIQHSQKQQAELQQHIDMQQQQQQQTTEQLQHLFSTHAMPLAVTSSADWQTRLEQQLIQHQQRLQHSEQTRQQLDTQQVLLTQQIELCINEQQRLHEMDTQYTATIQHWQAQHPDVDLQQTDYWLSIQPAHKQQLHAQRQQLQQAVQQADYSVHIYKQQLQQNIDFKPELSLLQLQHQLEQLQLNLSQMDETCTALKVRTLQDKQQQAQTTHYLAALQKAKLEHYRWDKISNLIGDAKGARFKNLAQQFHLHMLVEMANQQLIALTPRYELRCLEDSLGLTIVDHYMNDEIRPVLSLSGGESFLVSLALALGIAHMASGSTKLESLFIDEGFGTLDQSSLHVVMDALDRLQSQGRKVILISHITEMHERIPVKIQVLPQGSGASRIEVVG